MAPLLATDGYKLSMAEAGWPLRDETFYFTFRRGGAQVVPFDVDRMVRSLLPSAVTEDDYTYLAENEYGMGMAFKAAMRRQDASAFIAAPKGTWVLPREPILTVSGASALVSWLEPLVLQAHYRIQLATLAKRARDPAKRSRRRSRS